MDKSIVIRKAERQDVPLLLEFIRGIARYEKMENVYKQEELFRKLSFKYIINKVPIAGLPIPGCKSGK